MTSSEWILSPVGRSTTATLSTATLSTATHLPEQTVFARLTDSFAIPILRNPTEATLAALNKRCSEAWGLLNESHNCVSPAVSHAPRGGTKALSPRGVNVRAESVHYL